MSWVTIVDQCTGPRPRGCATPRAHVAAIPRAGPEAGYRPASPGARDLAIVSSAHRDLPDRIPPSTRVRTAVRGLPGDSQSTLLPRSTWGRGARMRRIWVARPAA